MLTSVPQWVAIYTNPRAEKRVCQRIQDSGIESFLPLKIEKRHWSDRIKVVEEPLFRSYLFAKITKYQLTSVKETDGVAYIIAFKGNIATVPEEQIEAVRKAVEVSERIYVHQTSLLRKGVKVIVQEGPFAQMQGTIISNCHDGNFAIHIDALSLSLVTEIDKNLLTPVEKLL